MIALILFLTAVSSLADEEDGELWTDEWGWTQQSQPEGNPFLQPGRTPTPVVPMTPSGPTSLELRGNTYSHTVRVYEAGGVVCEGSTGQEPRDSPGAAAERAMWLVKECLRLRLYSEGMGHEEVRARISQILSRESCSLEGSRDDRTTHWDYRSTMTCIVPQKVQKK